VDRIDQLAAGRDRVVDAARGGSIVLVAIGHWLVIDLRRTATGTFEGSDVLAHLVGLQVLTWVFQVMPVFFAAGGAVGFASWRRHRERGGAAAAWVSGRLWRLAWPTLPVIAFWTVVTQFGRHTLGLSPGLLDATRGIALVVWFLAIYTIVIALVPALEALCGRFGWRVPVALGVAAVAVDVGSFLAGYRSSTTPAWPWVNYLLVWATVTTAGRWWPATATRAAARIGAVTAAVALVALVLLTSLGPYPVAMVGVAGQARSNSTPPTVVLIVLAAVQIGLLLLARAPLERLLARPRVYGLVALVGARTMTIYLWHLLPVAVLALGLVLPGLWPAPAIGSAGWWAAKVGWVLLAGCLTIPVVWLAGRFERPPSVALATSPARVVAATQLLAFGWAALAIQGFHPTDLPGGVPVFALVPLAAAVAVLVRRGPERPAGSAATRPGTARGSAPVQG
jgi:fucose 4-O-acetylase-like acetyltransferase